MALRIILELLSLEITFVNAHEACCMASLITSHLMNAIMKRIKIIHLGNLGSFKLICAGSLLSSHTNFNIGLCVVQNRLAKELSITCCMASFLHSIVLKSTGYLGITLTVSLTSHSQIHAYFSAFTSKSFATMAQQFLRNISIESDT